MHKKGVKIALTTSVTVNQGEVFADEKVDRNKEETVKETEDEAGKEEAIALEYTQTTELLSEVKSVDGGTTITPDRFEGNDSNTNREEEKHKDCESEKIESPTANGVYTVADNKIKITIDENNKIATVESLSDDIKIKFIHMKGSNAFNCYIVEDGVTKVIQLKFPENDNNDKGNIPEISHITILWKDKGPTTPGEPPVDLEPPVDPSNPDNVEVYREETTTPKTGEMGILGSISATMGSLLGLAGFNRKKDSYII